MSSSKLVVFLLGLILIPMAFSLPNVSITFNGTFSATLQENDSASYILNVTNFGDIDVTNVSLSPVPNLNSTIITLLPANSSSNISVFFKPTTVFSSTTFASTLSFLFPVYLDAPLKQVEVTVNSSTIFPSNITVNQNDTIDFNNIGIEQETIYKFVGSSTFALFTLQPNETKNLSFPDINSLDIFAQGSPSGNISASATINIENRTKENFAHSSSFDKIFPFTLQSTLPPTTLSITVFIDTFSIDFDQTAVSVLRVQNTGSQAAANLQISGHWINVSNSSVAQLNAGQSFLSFFVVSPQNITQSSDTGITYPLTLTVSSDNTPSVSANLSVFINAHNFTSNSSVTNGTQFVFLLDPEAIAAFCKQNPTRCPINNISSTQYVQRTLFPAINESDVNNILSNTLPSLDTKIAAMDKAQAESNANSKDAITGVQTNVNQQINAMASNISGLQLYIQNLSDRLSAANEFIMGQNQKANAQNSDYNDNITAWSIAGIALIIVGLCIGSGIYIWNNNKKKKHYWKGF